MRPVDATPILRSALAAAVCLGCSAAPSMQPSGAPPSYPGTDTLQATPMAPAFTPMTSAPRTVQVSISSESFGQQGFPWSASPPAGEPVFVDGWALRFSRILVTVKDIRLNGPGTTPSDPAAVGAAVALNPRAYAVNVQRTGSLTGAGGGDETAVPLFVFAAADSGASLDATVRYALSYDLVTATRQATNINLDGDDLTAYQRMIDRGWTQLVEGTATYRGATPAAGSAFASYPTAVSFSFGYGAPARYANCVNPDNGGDATPGVQPSATRHARAQLTLHMDHLFWEALGREDPPLHFDPMAARATGDASAARVTLDDLVGVVPTNLRDRMNRSVPDRGAQTMGYTARNPMALSLDPGGASGINDLRDFVVYSARASGHLNADGLCAVRSTGPLRF